MFHKPVSGLSGIVSFVLCASIAAAQDFHVETTIFDMQASPPKSAARKETKPQLVGACESLFHAGKVYDHNRGLNQMTIYEPAQERFVIVDEARSLATVVPFDEITSRILRDRATAEAYVAEAEEKGLSAETIAFIKFQLKPAFQEKFTPDPQHPVLLMTSPLVEYRVDCAPHGMGEAVLAYLEYADWAHRLSFVTRRQAMLPEARLAVNEALRRRKLLPVKVTLHTRVPNGIHYRADHKFLWELNGYNKTTISHWDKKAAAKTTKYIPWEKFIDSPAETAKRR